VDRAIGGACFHIRFDFHEFFRSFEFVADSGEDRRLPIQAKKECEITGRANISMTPTNSGAGFIARLFLL